MKTRDQLTIDRNALDNGYVLKDGELEVSHTRTYHEAACAARRYREALKSERKAG